MNTNRFTQVSGCVFAIVAGLHLLRALLGTQMIIGDWIVPIWLSWIAFLGAGWLSFSAFRLSRW